MEEKRLRGRPRIGMIDDLKEGSYIRMNKREWRGEVGCRDLPEGRELMMKMIVAL